jgi:hypothetical protein
MTNTQILPLDIGVDLDGVAYDFSGALRDYIADSTGRRAETMPDPAVWHFYSEQWGMTHQEYLAAAHKAVDSGRLFGEGAAMEGAAAGTQALLRAGHRVHLVTDRAGLGSSGAAQRNTMRWLAAEQIAYTTLTFTSDKTSVRTDRFIDDRAENFLALELAGVDAYLRDQPWNAHVACRPGRRVSDFTAFVQTILPDFAVPAAA